MHLACLLSLLVLLSAVPAAAFAVEVPCSPAEAGTIVLDGLSDDWREVPALQGSDPGVSLRCNTEGKTLYLAIEVADERVVRTKQAKSGEDHVTLTVGRQRYTLFPAAGAEKAKAVPATKVASSSNDKGFVIELAFPFGKFAGLGRGLERLPVSLRFDDCDAAASLKTERTVTVAGELAFTAGESTLDSFLNDRGLTRSHVRWRKPIKVAGKRSELILAGKLVAVVGDGYGFVELPVADGGDVRNPRLVDLAGDGRPTVVLEYTERGGGGERVVLAAFRPEGNGVRRVFAAEIGKRTSEGGRLSSKVDLKRHGKATDIVLSAQPAQGLTADTYKEAPASDLVPILLPWAAPKKAVYTFSGDGYTQK
jgi:hypothetical protein